MRCPYCGCRSSGCGFCSVPGWEDDVKAMKEAVGTEEPTAEGNQISEENDDTFYKLYMGILGYDPRLKRRD